MKLMKYFEYSRFVPYSQPGILNWQILIPAQNKANAGILDLGIYLPLRSLKMKNIYVESAIT